MKKNTASQIVGAQLSSKTDGSAVTTGTTTVYVTGDGGTQATGSVGSGAATHEGQGFWTYAPAQAETNYDHVAFTFANTNAVSATIQIYPSFPQTGDNYARIGAPAGASVSADIAAAKTVVDAVKVKTDFLPSATAGASGGVFIAGTNAATTITTSLTTTFTGNLTGSVASVTGAVGSVTGNVGGNVTGSVGSVTGAVGSVTGAVGSVTGNVGGNVTGSVGSLGAQAKLDVNAEADTAISDAALATAASLSAAKTVVDAIKVKTDSLTFTQAGNVDANIQYVNDTQIQGTGAVGTDEWRKV